MYVEVTSPLSSPLSSPPVATVYFPPSPDDREKRSENVDFAHFPPRAGPSSDSDAVEDEEDDERAVVVVVLVGGAGGGGGGGGGGGAGG